MGCAMRGPVRLVALSCGLQTSFVESEMHVGAACPSQSMQ